MKTLPDYLRPGLRIVSIGLNPSLPSVEAGFYFANPRNRFWRALNRSGLAAGPVTPSVKAMEILFERDDIGFTDVVKRPTRGGAELRAASSSVSSRSSPGFTASGPTLSISATATNAGR
jgi:TDG/mug DNA glycosylase family protein